MSVENEVANLTTSVDNLTGAVNVKKQTLDATVADSEAARDQSQTARDTALTYRDQSLSHANDALAYSQDAASAVAYQDLASIAESKAESAVDVFVYDTSRDSDGGAWRHRTQHTSWYNEPLNTATRGARREFPAVAVIVAEADTVTIYDGDDPSLPMWAVYEQDNSATDGRQWFHNVFAVTSLSAINGKIYFGSGGGDSRNATLGLHFVDFIGDLVGRYSALATRGGFGLNASSGSKTDDLTSLFDEVIADFTVNDVAMTVLPDAPIDEATGLPVPTIAVATDGGVSVIKDDGAVVDITHSDGNDARQVYFTEDNLLAINPYHQMHGVRLMEIPDTDVSNGKHYKTGQEKEWYANNNRSDLDTKLANSYHDFPIKIADDRDVLRMGFRNGLASVSRQPSNPSLGLMNYTTSTYNTGWMPGDTKGAFLSDTDDTDLVGSGELVTNGDFGTGDLTGWYLNDPVNSTATVNASGQVEVTNTVQGAYLDQIIPVEIGRTYIVNGDFIQKNGGGRLMLYDAVATAQDSRYIFSSNSITDFIFVARTNQLVIRLGEPAASGSLNIYDNLSVKAVDHDRSVNGKPLIVNGTVTREPVATGADLVAYSGFRGSTGNYLNTFSNSLDGVAAGDFFFATWYNSSNGPGPEKRYIFRKGSGNPGIKIFANYGDGHPVFRVGDGAVIESLNGSRNMQTREWRHMVCLRRGNFLEIYVDGVLDVSTTWGGGDFSANGAEGTVGIRDTGTDNESLQSDSLALLRIGATAPTPEQIKRIYEDEKFLFQENAQATLYGNSDAVTALAHDEVTDLLHVGTSDGRSVFQGLRRVDNTTDPVGTAISAHNGMIAEE